MSQKSEAPAEFGHNAGARLTNPPGRESVTPIMAGGPPCVKTSYEIAREYTAAGLSVIPIRADGSKALALKTGERKTYETRLANDEELAAWFGDGRRRGPAVLCGAVSGNAEVIDFDLPGALAEFERIAADNGAAELLARLVFVQSPRDPACGHLWYRCPDGVSGSLKLAFYPNPNPNPEPGEAPWLCSIETRGQGGYAIVPGGPLTMHATGRPWVLVRGDLCNLPVISGAERAMLLQFARMCDERPPEEEPEQLTTPHAAAAKKNGNLSPLDDYNARADLGGLAEKHGWKRTGPDRFRRPGKTHGHSASIHNGRFWCWTSNAAPLEQNKSYTPAALYATLEHGGDFKAARAALAALGYGATSAPAAPPRSATAPPPAAPAVTEQEPANPAPLRSLADIAEIQDGVQWAWPGFIPCGFVTAIVAAPGVGKSLLALELARRVFAGECWPDGTELEGGGAEVGKVLLCESEGRLALTRKRARDWGFDLRGLVLPQFENPLESVRLTNPEHKRLIREAALRDEVSLLVFDSFSAGFGGDENTNAALAPMQWLSELATETGKPLLLIHHLRKKGRGDAAARVTLDDVRGHSSITQTPVVFIALSKPDPEQKDARRLEVIKNNLAVEPEPLGFTIGTTDGRITFTDSVPEIPRPQTKLQDAIDFLLELLARGAMPEAAIREQAERQGINARTLRRAKGTLGLASIKDGSGGWKWGLRSRAF